LFLCAAAFFAVFLFSKFSDYPAKYWIDKLIEQARSLTKRRFFEQMLPRNPTLSF